MSTKQKMRDNPDVGASKAAKGIIGSLDRRLVEPARLLVRYSGWVFLATIIYVAAFGIFNENEREKMFACIFFYAFYMVVLEAFRKLPSRFYDSSLFRITRIAINLLAVSVLINIAPIQRYLLIFGYMVPLFATIVYFAERNWIKAGIYLLAVFGLYVGGIYLDHVHPLGAVQFIVFAVLLAFLGLGFEIVRRRVHLVPSRLTELAKEFHKTLDLHQLMKDILENAIEITQAQRGLIIIINPRTRKYVGHILNNFALREDHSIEDLARRCFVLVHGRPFESADMEAAFNNKTIYHEFFSAQPRSVMAEPLHNRAGQVMGVINVAHDDPNGFDPISGSLLKEFAFLVGNAIENCLEHREVKLREAKNREALEKFVSAGSEDEAIHILIHEVRQQIQHAEKLTIHQLMPRDDGLLPIHSYSLDTTPNRFLWSGPKPRKLKPDLRLGYGIAGHALESRDTILVPDADHHPWYVQLDHAQDIKSLLVAPLFDAQGHDLYGAISLESSKPSVFSLEDESTLAYLSTQASRAIAKVRDFQAWREHGGTMRRILEKIQSYNLSTTEDEILQQIADAACELLGFGISRIRILDESGLLVTKAVSGVSEKTRRKLMEVDLPYAKLHPFLNEKFRAESSFLITHGDSAWKQLVDQYFHISQRKMHKKQRWHAYDALITPLLDSSGNLLAVLTLDLPVNGSEPNRQILESVGLFASSAGWMIELGRFQRRLRDQQHRAQSFIDTISQELAKGRDLDTICEVVVQVGAKLLSADGCSLHLKRGNYIELTHSNFLANTDHISRSKPISAAPKAGLTAWVAATGEVLCFNNEKFQEHEAWAGDDQHLQYLPDKTCRSVLLAPVKDKDGNVIGVITLENKRTLAGPKDFDHKDKERLISLANEFAKALEIIGLYEDIKEWERTGLAEDLHDLINWYHSGVVLWIEALEAWLQQGEITMVHELMPALRRHALTTIFELKELHTNLLRNSLEAESFKQALEETMLAWKNRVPPKYKQPMQISLVCPENLEIPPGLKNIIIRIASLAFSNAIQHSGIIEDPNIKVWVSVEQKESEVTLAVIDTGKGVDFKRTPEGFGLGRMRQLTEKINNWGNVKAGLFIETAIDHGTKVLLKLKLRNTRS